MTDGWMTDNGQPEQAKPKLTVLGVFRGGMLVRAEWSGEQIQLSDKTIAGCKALGMIIDDNPDYYVFKGQVY